MPQGLLHCSCSKRYSHTGGKAVEVGEEKSMTDEMLDSESLSGADAKETEANP
jgi:hypothetical protein